MHGDDLGLFRLRVCPADVDLVDGFIPALTLGRPNGALIAVEGWQGSLGVVFADQLEVELAGARVDAHRPVYVAQDLGDEALNGGLLCPHQRQAEAFRVESVGHLPHLGVIQEFRGGAHPPVGVDQAFPDDVHRVGVTADHRLLGIPGARLGPNFHPQRFEVGVVRCPLEAGAAVCRVEEQREDAAIAGCLVPGQTDELGYFGWDELGCCAMQNGHRPRDAAFLLVSAEQTFIGDLDIVPVDGATVCRRGLACPGNLLPHLDLQNSIHRPVAYADVRGQVVV